MAVQISEIEAKDAPFPDLSDRILSGEVFLARGCLQHFGLFQLLEDASDKGIRDGLGDAIADEVRKHGVHKIHDFVDAADIPPLADRIYDIMKVRSLDFLKPFVTRMLGREAPFYFERMPNVRFHIPYDLSEAHRAEFEEFAKRHGDGKITAHSPHRDSWVDCPGNLINVWIAVGKIERGNSLLIYPESYDADIANEGAYIAPGEDPGPAVTFEMEPGDVLLFHGDQMHGSEVNWTESTRHVISFRVVLEKPHYPNGHYHHYAHSSLAFGPLDFLAEVPQNLAPSWVRWRAKRVVEKAGEALGRKPAMADRRAKAQLAKLDADGGLPLSELENGAVRAIAPGICVTRLENGEVRAFGRYCPHQGADLAHGRLVDGSVMCPWHNLPLDPETGASPCKSLKKIKTYACEVRDGKVYLEREID